MCVTFSGPLCVHLSLQRHSSEKNETQVKPESVFSAPGAVQLRGLVIPAHLSLMHGDDFYSHRCTVYKESITRWMPRKLRKT